MDASGGQGFPGDAEYASIARAVRVLATAGILLAGYRCWQAASGISTAMEILENMVQGGLGSLPEGVTFVLHHGTTLAGGAGMAGALALIGVWLRARRIAAIIYAGLAGMVALFAVTAFIESATGGTLETVFRRFNG
jgi:hypothetical protein